MLAVGYSYEYKQQLNQEKAHAAYVADIEMQSNRNIHGGDWKVDEGGVGFGWNGGFHMRCACFGLHSVGLSR